MELSQETLTVGKRLVELCQKGENVKAVDQLYARDAESLEAISMPGMPDKVRGIETIRRKNQEWERGMKVNSMTVEGPFPFGDRFAVVYKVDATDKKTKERMKIEEVGLYTVHNGKIVREEFFYSM